MPKIHFHCLDIMYRITRNKALIHLFGRTIDNKQVCVIDDSFQPYFWVILEDNDDFKEFQRKALKLKVETKKGDAFVTKLEQHQKKHLGKDVQTIKLFVNLPSSVPAIRQVIKEWDMVKEIYEYDIKFIRRYLIDKALTPLTLWQAEGDFIQGNLKVPIFKATNIKQESTDSIKPRILAIDIETYNPLGKAVMPEKHPIIMLGYKADKFEKVTTWKHFKTKHKYINFVKSEIELLEDFKETIEKFKPDIITGYFSDGFDFPYIIERAKKYKIKLNIGLDNLEPMTGRGRAESIKLNGIVHVDVFKFIKSVMSRTLETDSYRLDDVATEILGQKKQEIEMEKLAEVWDKHPKKLEQYCTYNLQDCNLTLGLLKKIYPLIEEMVKLVNLPLFDTSRMGFSQLVEWHILKQAPLFNEIASNKPHHNQIKERRLHTFTGAFVYEPKPGLYDDIIVFDFRSLYPTIITSHNISPDTLKCGCCRGKAEKAPTEHKKYWFCKQKKGFIPTIVEDLITRRMRVKEILKKEKKKNPLLNARSEGLKLLANATYGYYGFFGARWYSLECAKSITAYGRYYIKKVINKAQKKGFNVLYSDTDSVFLTLGKKTMQDAKEFVKIINKDLPGIMELEFEGHYPKGIFVPAKQGSYGAKKKYALVSNKGVIKIKGFEAVRRNWSTIAKQVQQKVLNMILKYDKQTKAFEYVKEVIHDLRTKKVNPNKLIIVTQLQKDIADYETYGPHVAAAQRMQSKGEEVPPGTMISYIVAEGKGRIRDRVKLPDEIKDNDYDSEYYIKHQIVPAVQSIFEVLGFKSEDLLESKDQSKLGSFF